MNACLQLRTETSASPGSGFVQHEVLAVYLAKLLDTVDAAGVDPAALLSGSGLERQTLRDRNLRIPLQYYYAAIEKAQQLVEEPGLGLRVGQRTTVAEHGVLGYAVLSSATLGKAIRMLIRYQKLMDPTLRNSLAFDGEMAVLTLDDDLIPEVVRSFIVDEWLACWSGIRDIFYDIVAPFAEVRLPFGEPAHAQQYRDLCGCPVRFDQARAQILIPVGCLDLPISFANEAVETLCEIQCKLAMQQMTRGNGLISRIRNELLKTPGRFPSLERVAERLHFSSRSLRRHLQAAGTSFQTILSEVRMELAKKYLRETEFTVQHISLLLDYSETSNFIRAFKKWVGLTPQAYRDSQTIYI